MSADDECLMSHAIFSVVISDPAIITALTEQGQHAAHSQSQIMTEVSELTISLVLAVEVIDDDDKLARLDRRDGLLDAVQLELDRGRGGSGG